MRSIQSTLRILCLLSVVLLAGSSMLTGQPYPTSSYTLSEDGTTLVLWKGLEKEIDLASDPAFAGLKVIGKDAFALSNKLQKIRLSAGVVSIEEQAFLNCQVLTEVQLNEGLQTIGARAFSDCYELPSIYVPQNVETIEKMAFGSCHRLATITVAEDNAHYKSKDGMLYNKDGTLLIACGAGWEGAYTIPDGVKTLGMGAFFQCKGLTGITINNTVKTIEGRVFMECSGLTSVVIPHTVDSLGSQAFEQCAALKEIRLSDALTIINRSTFKYCEALESITIPHAVKTIAPGAFSNCKSLTQVDIPASVQEILEDVFFNCTNMKAIHVAPENPAYCSIDGILYNKEKTKVLQCGMAWAGDYTTPEEVKIIGKTAFYGCRGITSVQISNSVELIELDAFEGCSNMASVSLGESIEWIGPTAFSKCTALKEIAIPAATASISEGAFSKCSNLATVHLKEGVKWIGNYVFSNCTSLKSIELPHSVKTIEINAFEYCTALESVSIGKGVEKMGSGTFLGCSALKSITSHRETPPVLMGNNFSGVPQDVKLYVPEGSINLYAQADVWNQITNILPIDYTSTEAVTEIKTRLYPNPATDYLWVEIPSSVIGKRANLIDASGRLIRDILLTNERMTIELKALPAGLYFLRLGATVEKIIVERK